MKESLKLASNKPPVPIEDEPPAITRGLEYIYVFEAGRIMGGITHTQIWKKDGKVAAVRDVEYDMNNRLHRVTDREPGKSTVREYWASGYKKVQFEMRGDEMHGPGMVWDNFGRLVATRDYAHNM